MNKHIVTICCWRCTHQIELQMTKRQEEKLSRDLMVMKAVCPTCRNDDAGNHPIFIKDGTTLVNPSKVYSCSNGHATTIGLLGDSMLHVCFGANTEDFVNVEASIEELSELVDSNEISCHHIQEDGTPCDCSLRPIDDYVPSLTKTAGFKTRTRIGDVWDKQGIEPVRNGSYDSQGHYNQTKTETANRERLRRMRDRNIPIDKHPGKRIDKPTSNIYNRRDKGSISQ